VVASLLDKAPNLAGLDKAPPRRARVKPRRAKQRRAWPERRAPARGTRRRGGAARFLGPWPEHLAAGGGLAGRLFPPRCGRRPRCGRAPAAGGRKAPKMGRFLGPWPEHLAAGGGLAERLFPASLPLPPPRGHTNHRSTFSAPPARCSAARCWADAATCVCVGWGKGRPQAPRPPLGAGPETSAPRRWCYPTWPSPPTRSSRRSRCRRSGGCPWSRCPPPRWGPGCGSRPPRGGCWWNWSRRTTLWSCSASGSRAARGRPPRPAGQEHVGERAALKAAQAARLGRARRRTPRSAAAAADPSSTTRPLP
jgi:hypothetical protein